MNLRAEAIVQKPREAVFEVYRDSLIDLVPDLPSVQGIEIKSRKVEGDKVEMVNVWKGGGEIPSAIRSFLSESMMSWTDYALWDESDYTCTWRSESHSFKEAVDSRGKNEFVDLGQGRMAIRINGNISVDASKVPGVPKLLAGTAGGLIERFLIKQVQDNLKEVAAGVERYLDRRG